MCALFNKETAKAMAKMAASLKAESQARAEAERKLKAEIESKAAIEQKIKAEAEKMLLDQFNKYNALVERAEARTKEAMAEAKAQVREAEEKVLAYEIELAQTQERLDEVRELMKNQAIARAKAEENLLIESEHRRRVEAELEEAIAFNEAKAHEKVQPFAEALTVEKEGPVEAEEQEVEEPAETRIVAEIKEPVKTEIEEPVKVEVKEQQEYIEPPVQKVYSVKCVRRRHVFSPANLKRKFVYLLVIAIFSAITFAFSVNNKQPADEPRDSMIKKTETPAVEVALASGNMNKEILKTDVKSEMSLVSLRKPEPVVTTAPALNYKSEDNVAEPKNVAVVKTRTLRITASPAPLKITASAGFMKNIVRYSDNHRMETMSGTNMYYNFSDVSIPADAVVKSAVLFVEHFEDEQFAEGKLEWTIGTGRPGKAVVWAAMKAPVHEGESAEAIDAWDISSVADSAERLNSLQLQVINNDVARKKTFVDYAYVVVEYQ
jgi:hypothetical protein